MALVRSLRARVILWVSVALTALFAVTIIGLDVAFRENAERALRLDLEAQALGLIALAEPDAIGELTIPVDAVDPPLEVAESGLYAALFDGDGFPLWQSLSLLGRGFPAEGMLRPNERRFVAIDQEGLPPLEALLMGIDWEFEDGQVARYTVGVAVSLEPYNARQLAFRRNLIGWFAGITLTMLIVISGLLRFVLRPLQRLERQVREVEAGERTSLTGNYPSELVGLAANLNALIETERRRLTRYRHTLDDLAHSLKTPLAAMRTLLSEWKSGGSGGPTDALQRELERMDQRVSYQLRRARASGATGLGTEPAPVAPIVEDLKQTPRQGLSREASDLRAQARPSGVVSRRSGRLDRDSRQPDGQRLQVLPLAGARDDGVLAAAPRDYDRGRWARYHARGSRHAIPARAAC